MSGRWIKQKPPKRSRPAPAKPAAVVSPGHARPAGRALSETEDCEYAARGGTTGETYGALDAIAWYRANGARTTHPVGHKLPNAFGLYDMLGNVWQ